MVKKLFKAKYLYPVSRPIINNGAILVQNGEITKIGELSEFTEEDLQDAETHDFGDSCILPGLINAHTHLEYTSLGKLNAKSMKDFLWQTIEKTANWSESKIRESVKQGIKQSIESGVTTLVDISRWGISPLVLSEYPIISDVALEAFSFDEKSSKEVFNLLKEKIKYIESRISPKVRLSISPHSPYNSDPSLWEQIINYTLEHNMLIHSHIAESIEEKKWFEFGSSEIDDLHRLIGWPKISPQVTSLSPVEYLSMMQLLPSNLLAAHLCYASTRDLELLEDKNVNIIICPRSNTNLHKKMIEHDLLRSLKIKALIGTDGVTSSGNLNILEDLRLYNTKNQISIDELTKMVTIYPAKALKLDEIVGSLQAGKLANFIVFDGVDSPENWINYNKPSHVFVEGNNLLAKAAK